MTRFTNGPAARSSLNLKFFPKLLRVTTTARGGVDALDAPLDTPAAGETMHAYRLERIEKLLALVCTRGKGGSSFSAIHHYRLNDVQPTQADMLSSLDWQAWCRAQSPIVLREPRAGGRCCSWFQPGEAVLVADHADGIKEGASGKTIVATEGEYKALKDSWPICPVEIGIGPPVGQPHVVVLYEGATNCAPVWWRNVFRLADLKAAEERRAFLLANHESPSDQFDTINEVFP